MKLFNVITVWDVWAVAENEDDARAAVLGAIREGEDPSEATAIQTRQAKQIREAWVSKSPFIGAEVSDDDFAQCKGKTTADIFSMLNEKEPTLAKK